MEHVKDSSFVFVYGTLKKDRGNHRTMDRARGRFIGEWKTDPVWTMYHLGGFPAIVPDGHTSIKGEVYEVDSLEPLDALEGYPNFYNRVLIDTQYGPAWVYFIPSESFKANRNIIQSGEW